MHLRSRHNGKPFRGLISDQQSRTTEVEPEPLLVNKASRRLSDYLRLRGKKAEAA